MRLKCWIRPQTAVFDNVGPHISAHKFAICADNAFFASHEVLGVDVRSVSESFCLEAIFKCSGLTISFNIS